MLLIDHPALAAEIITRAAFGHSLKIKLRVAPVADTPLGFNFIDLIIQRGHQLFVDADGQWLRMVKQIREFFSEPVDAVPPEFVEMGAVQTVQECLA